MFKNTKKKQPQKEHRYRGENPNFYKYNEKDASGNIILEEQNYNKENKQVVMTKQPGWKLRHKEDAEVMTLFQKFLYLSKPVLIIIVVFVILFRFILLNGIVPSSSMETNIMVGDWILSNCLAYNKDTPPQRGDVIVFNSNEYENSLLVKRVIGVPGDTVELYDSHVYINGCKLVEDKYVTGNTEPLKLNKTTFQVPENSVLVLGDNRENSIDSRYWDNSYISYDDIRGKVLIRYSILSKNGTYVEKIKHIQPIITSDYFNLDLTNYNIEKEEQAH